MRRFAIINLTVITILNIFIIIYVYFIGKGSGEVSMSAFSVNLIVIIGFLCGIISLVLMVRFGRSNKEKLTIPIISTGLSLLIIPHTFIISLIYFFGSNR
jgi:hypothetical protein